MKDCYKHKTHLESQKKPVSLLSKLDSSDDRNGNHEWLETVKHFGDHLLTGSLSVSEDAGGRLVTILRDTGAAVSVVLRSSYPE